MAVRVRAVVAISRFPPEPRLVAMLEARLPGRGPCRGANPGSWTLAPVLAAAAPTSRPRLRTRRPGRRTCRWLSCCASGCTRPDGPRRPVFGPTKISLRSRREKAVHELLRSAACRSRWRPAAPARGRPRAGSRRRRRGHSGGSRGRCTRTAARSRRRAAGSGRRIPIRAARGWAAWSRCATCSTTRTRRSVPQRRQTRFGVRRSTGSHVKKVRPSAGRRTPCSSRPAAAGFRARSTGASGPEARTPPWPAQARCGWRAASPPTTTRRPRQVRPPGTSAPLSV